MIFIYILVVTFFNFVLLGEPKARDYPLWGDFFLRFWCVELLSQSLNEFIDPYFAETPLKSTIWRLFGADVGKGVLIGKSCQCKVFPLLRIEDDVLLCEDTVIQNAKIRQGQLRLHKINIRANSTLEPGCIVLEDVPKDEYIFAESYWKSAGFRSKKHKRNDHIDMRSRILLIPLLILMRQIPYLFIWSFWQNSLYFHLALPFIFHFGVCFIYVFIIGLFHRYVYSLFPPTHYQSNLAWFNRRLHSNAQLSSFYGDLTSTEILSYILRWYGSAVGDCAQLDIGSLLEPHKVQIGSDVIFGSSTKLLTLLPDGSSGRIIIEDNSNIMDRTCVSAPLKVRKRVVLGSRSVVPGKTSIQEGGVYTGSRKGEAVYLWPNEEMVVNNPMHNRNTFFYFNFILLLQSIVSSYLMDLHYFVILESLVDSSFWTFFPRFFIIDCILNSTGAFIYVFLQRCIIVEWKEGDFSFSSSTYLAWLGCLKFQAHLEKKILRFIQGTEFICMWLRLLGADIGKSVFFHGYTVETNLLSLGDFATAAWDIDGTCHTAHSFNLRLNRITIGKKAVRGVGTTMQPGSQIGCGSVLAEGSLLLDGENTGENCIWRGRPAIKIADFDNTT